MSASLVFVARAAVAAAVLGAAFVLTGAAWWADIAVAAGVLGVAIWAFVGGNAARSKCDPIARQVAEVGCAVAGLGLGTHGHADLAVAAVIPAAFVGASGLPVVAAAAFGLAGAAMEGYLTLTVVVPTAVLFAAGWWAALAGGVAADRTDAADRERVSLDLLRTEMVTSISHELRTPLTVIRTATATLTRRWDVLTEHERLDLIDVLTDNAASLDASILHFVDAARLENGHVVLTPAWVELRPAVAAALAARAQALAGHNIQTELDVDAVWVDPDALQRILEHLLMNAARFSPIGSPIIVRTITGPAELVLKVTDRGQGMPPHIQVTAWEPLQRGDVSETGISRGAGLGLPIVRELARLHGGDANLTSVRGRGTTVSVSLPQPPRPATDRPASARPAGARSASGSTPEPTSEAPPSPKPEAEPHLVTKRRLRATLRESAVDPEKSPAVAPH